MDSQDTQQETFQNDKIELTVNKKPKCLVEFEVKVQPKAVEESHKKAIKGVAKEASIPGFRKGKAPSQLILKNFPAAVKERWHKILAEVAFKECETLANIPILNNDSKITFNMVDCELDKGANLTFSFESEPEIPELDFSKITLDKVEKEPVDEKKVDETIHRIRLYFSKWQEVKDREVKEDDFIIVDVMLLEEDGKETPAFTNTRLEVNPKNMATWMREIVIGMKPGDEKEGLSTPDDDATEEDKEKFEPKKVKVHLKTIEEPVLPPVDDELAKKVGVDSADIMKERLNALLNKQADDECQKTYRDKLCDQLLDVFVFELPGSLLDKEIEYRLQQQRKSKAYMDLSNDDKAKEDQKVREQAEKAVRLFYLCKKIVADNKLTFSLEDLTRDIKTPLDAMFADRDALNPNKSDQEKAALMSKLMLTQAQDFAIGKILGTS